MFDLYLLSVKSKTCNASAAFDEVTLFGLYAYQFVSGFMSDPTRGTGKVVYHRSRKGLITKVLDKVRSLG